MPYDIAEKKRANEEIDRIIKETDLKVGLVSLPYPLCPKCKRSMIPGTLEWYCNNCDVWISRREKVSK